ncbi:hypothetical protein Poli38472_008843 [Pythium oligandrum]|uniref:Elongator complex protein 2 n=1 Tax=Pythium oligandrum TaxID=41045 RepID=A0A8K1C4E4_PYTOL|nr:hypothetical protein Poli38472_008843 [Pythium oligandrum]|eukprot:TMW56195.1 hypothetical protein Poli38472_008843 [Pythium oligandrum]
MDATLEHVAVGCNAISNAFGGNSASPTSHGTHTSAFCGAFGAKNGVALIARQANRPALLEIRHMLQHRVSTKDSTRITSVYLHAPVDGAPRRVLAGDSEGNVFLWLQADESTEWTLHHLSSSEQTMHSVSAVTAVATRRRWLYVIAFSDGQLRVFEQRHESETVEPIATLSLSVKMIMETLSSTVWTQQGKEQEEEEEEDALVAAGGVDSKVYLFEIPSTKQAMNQLIALEGHRGWIRCVDFERRAASDSSSLLLASASQDQRVRLWKISSAPKTEEHVAPGYHAVGSTAVYTISFDSLLIGHEDWVTSLVWTLLPEAETSVSALVSSSMDNTIIVWKKDANVGKSGAWVPSLRVGEHGGNGILSPAVLTTSDYRLDLLALNFSGQLERWQQQPPPSKIFLPTASLAGHTSPVTDISWSPSGDYLLSTSLDQTTRILAPLQTTGSWHEISRAQVHGYDINCATFLAKTPSDHNDRFVCGADEKILRVFEAPDSLQELAQALKGETKSTEEDTESTRVQHAYLPELSLTNKTTVDQSDKKKKHGGFAVVDVEQNLEIPVGDTLARKTLWPEQRKLYGHGNELLCVTSNHAGTVIASACKSREERFAAVWLWNTTDWSVVQSPLEGHKSSVVQLAFSPNDEFLASVSRDRQFCVFQRQADEKYTLVDRVKAHKRIIWSCSWSPDSTLLVTGARDQTFAFWSRSSDSSKWSQLGENVVLPSAVTAVAFAPFALDEQSRKYLLAIGLESGHIQLFTVTVDDNNTLVSSLALELLLPQVSSATISRLAWSPSSTSTHGLLASASADHSVRLYRIALL